MIELLKERRSTNGLTNSKNLSMRLGIFLAGVIIPTAWSRADVGDEITVVVPQPSGVESYCAIGVAFDGTSLYVNRCGNHRLYRVHATSGGVEAVFDLATEIPERPARMAYDAKRNGIWIGTQKPSGLVAFDGCCEPGESAANCMAANRSMPV